MSAELRRDRATLAALALLSVILQLPFLDRGLSRLDEGSILAIAEDLARGDVLYRDRATFIGPLIYEGMHALGALFGSQLLVGRAFQALVFTACTLLVYRVLREFAGPGWSVFGALAFLAVKPLAFPLWTIPNYSQWATLEALVALLAGLRFLATHGTGWLLLAGFAVGLAGVTKQTSAGSLGIALAATVALDALLSREEAKARVRAIASRGALLALGALPPLAFFAIFYAGQGALSDAIDRGVVGLLSYSDALGVPLPGLDVWSLDPAVLGPRSFIYFPTAVLALAWQGGLNLYLTGMALAVEHAVKFVYYAPLLAALAGCFALRGLATPAPLAAQRILFLLLIAGFAYWSASFRADWTHLMSVMPELILLCVVMLHHFGRDARWLRGVAWALGAAWLLGGSLVAAAVFAAYDAPLETARGKLLVTPTEAEDTRRVLEWAAAQPSEDRIAFLPTQPLYYALTDRPILSAFDLLIPAYFRPGDDQTLAADLANADRIVYDPNAIPTVAEPLAGFAPESASVLAHRFGFTEALAPTAYVLEPLAPELQEGMLAASVLDLFDREDALPEPDKTRRVETTHWMMYRVLAASISAKQPGHCMSFRHEVGPDEALSFVPMLHPRLWSDAVDAAELRQLRFTVRAAQSAGPTRTLFSEVRVAGEANRPVEVALEQLRGSEVLLSLCASRRIGDTGSPGVAGWAEARIVHRRQAG